MVLSGISPSFPGLFPTMGQVTYVLLTRAPLYTLPEGNFLARLACVRHAASVRSEPGSNSPVKVAGTRRPQLQLGVRIMRLESLPTSKLAWRPANASLFSFQRPGRSQRSLELIETTKLRVKAAVAQRPCPGFLVPRPRILAEQLSGSSGEANFQQLSFSHLQNDGSARVDARLDIGDALSFNLHPTLSNESSRLTQ